MVLTPYIYAKVREVANKVICFCENASVRCGPRGGIPVRVDHGPLSGGGQVCDRAGAAVTVLECGRDAGLLVGGGTVDLDRLYGVGVLHRSASHRGGGVDAVHVIRAGGGDRVDTDRVAGPDVEVDRGGRTRRRDVGVPPVVGARRPGDDAPGARTVTVVDLDRRHDIRVGDGGRDPDGAEAVAHRGRVDEGRDHGWVRRLEGVPAGGRVAAAVLGAVVDHVVVVDPGRPSRGGDGTRVVGGRGVAGGHGHGDCAPRRTTVGRVVQVHPAQVRLVVAEEALAFQNGHGTPVDAAAGDREALVGIAAVTVLVDGVDAVGGVLVVGAGDGQARKVRRHDLIEHPLR